MKVIITGATGYVGSQVLAYALAHPAISHIVLLQRRELDSPPANPANKRIETVIHEDFSSYPAATLARLAGAEAVLWALGGKHNNFADAATAWRVNVDFTRAAAEAFEGALVDSLPAGGGRKLRFVLCSGKGAEWDRSASLWFLAETRRMKGAAEQAFFAIVKVRPNVVEAYTCRPAVVIGTNPGFGEWLHGVIAPSVTVKELGATMVELGVNGDGETFWEFDMIGKKGRQVVKERGI